MCTMKKTILLITLLFIYGCGSITLKTQHEIQAEYKPQPQNQAAPKEEGIVKIANWNAKILGDKKVSNREFMFQAERMLKNAYDIIFIQEIRDEDGSAWYDFCQPFKLNSYECRISSRAGTTNIKEQYGLIYKTNLQIQDWKDYNTEQYQTQFERPPILVTFNINGYVLKIFNLHTDPDKATEEIKNLADVAEKEDGNVIITGDLNADCSYYSRMLNKDLPTWFWATTDEFDTTSTNTDCTYDRIILNSDAEKEYYATGIWSDGISTDISDHYIVWVALRTQEKSSDNPKEIEVIRISNLTNESKQ